MTSVVLGLGSNKSYEESDSVHLLAAACIMLEKVLQCVSPSSIYRTAPMYLENQNDFYNMVVGGKFDGTPEQLLDKIHKIENLLGRDRSKEVRNGERSLDLDIEIFGMEQVNKPDLIIPHERILERAFVLKPFLELLSENADVIKSGHYLNNNLALNAEIVSQQLSELSDQRIELYLEKSELLKLIDDKSFNKTLEQKYGYESEHFSFGKRNS